MPDQHRIDMLIPPEMAAKAEDAGVMNNRGGRDDDQAETEDDHDEPDEEELEADHDEPEEESDDSDDDEKPETSA